MRGSKGAIFVLMAISLVALFTVVALVVDLTSLYIARSKWKQNGDAACLAALDQYLITDGDISTRILAAQLRAQGFIGANTAQAGAFGGASVDTLHNQVNVIGVDQDDQPGANGSVRLGRWRAKDPEVDGSCWETEGAPCFDQVTQEDEDVTAARVEISHVSGSPIRSFFSHIFGQGARWFSTVSTCAITPKHIVVLVDLSRSIVSQTHIPFESIDPPYADANLKAVNAAEFAYYLKYNYDTDPQQDLIMSPGTGTDAGGENVCLTQHTIDGVVRPGLPNGNPNLTWNITEPWGGTLGPDTYLPGEPGSNIPAVCPAHSYSGGYLSYLPGRIYRSMAYNSSNPPNPIMTRPLGNTNPFEHYMSDYHAYDIACCVTGNYPEFKNCVKACERDLANYNGDILSCYLGGPGYVRHVQCAPNGTYGETGLWQPVNSMSHCAGYNLIDRGPDGNGAKPQPLYDILAGVHGLLESFQDRALHGDLVAMMGFAGVSFLPQRIMMLSPPQSPLPEGSDKYDYFGDMLKLTDSEHPGHFEQFRRRMFFPTWNYDTNLALSLRHALAMLAEAPSAGEATGAVIITSDLVGNCTNLPNAVTGRVLVSCPHYQDNAAAKYTKYLNSVNEIKSLVTNYFKKQAIAIHAAPVGYHVSPHTVLRKGVNGCMTSKEASALGQSGYVNPGAAEDAEEAYAEMFQGDPFVYANDFYNFAVKETGGLWGPLRPSCGCTSETCTNLMQALNDACEDLEEQGEAVEGAGLAALQASLDGMLAGDLDDIKSNVLDDEGRLLCDPEGRTTEQQMKEFMSEIMKVNSISLVGPD